MRGTALYENGKSLQIGAPDLALWVKKMAMSGRFVVWIEADEGRGPCMIPRTLSYKETASHRHFCCEHYDDCLEVAGSFFFGSFSCRACPLMIEKLEGEQP